MMWLTTRALGLGFACVTIWLLSLAMGIAMHTAAILYLILWVGLVDGRAIHAIVRGLTK